MAAILGKDTKPELMIRRGLHAKGFRYRLQGRGLPGRPDLVLPKHHAVIFVHGCFWHRHKGCSACYTPKTRTEFWENKFGDNVRRDRRNTKLLRQQGWRVLVVWECELSEIESVKIRLQHFL